jgi:hypothetical protein
MEKKEAQDLKAAEARSTCEECGEYGHVRKDCPEEAKVLDYMSKGELPNFRYGQGRPQFNASSSIPNAVPLRIQLKEFMDDQAKGVFGRAPSSSRFNKPAPFQFFPAKHPSSKNSRSTKFMDLAPNSTKSMECLKGYSAKPCFVLTRGVGWKLPTTATHYTNVPVRFFSPSRPVASPSKNPARPFLSSRAATVPPPQLFSPPAGPPETPEMTRQPLPPAPPLGSTRRVGLHRRPPPTLDGADEHGSTAVGAGTVLAGLGSEAASLGMAAPGLESKAPGLGRGIGGLGNGAPSNANLRYEIGSMVQ